MNDSITRQMEITINGKNVSLSDCYSRKKGEIVWVGYAKEPPHLPIAIASSAKELAQIMGVNTNSVESLWSKFRHGKVKHTRYACVLIEEE